MGNGKTDRHAIPAVLTIAGSDSGAGAGIQADLKTFLDFGVYGTSALTCVTAQHPGAVTAIQAVDAAVVVEQIRAVREGFPIAAAKTGMLYSAAIIRAVAAALRADPLPAVVVDPVMVATSGARLLREDAVGALVSDLLPLATVVTPNLPEAELLWGQPVNSRAAQEAAAAAIGTRFGTACVVKGGHADGGEIVDVLWCRGRYHTWSGPRVAAAETHGTGCAFSAGVTACLARGLSLPDAIEAARDRVAKALASPYCVGRHTPLGVGKAMKDTL